MEKKLHQHRPQTAASKVISARHPNTQWRQGETKGDEAKSSEPSIQTCHARHGERETKQNRLSPASRHVMGGKGRQRETKQNHLSPASRHAMGDRERQREINWERFIIDLYLYLLADAPNSLLKALHVIVLCLDVPYSLLFRLHRRLCIIASLTVTFVCTSQAYVVSGCCG